jgi:hypothetical protein
LFAACVVAAGALFATPLPAAAQLGAMVSPGKLTRAHASLEGVSNCQSCHEAGRGVTASKCLACHKPIAERIRLKKGIHREAAGQCVTCHVEHAGVDAELRPFDTGSFDHAREAGFTIDGKHAKTECSGCHKTRSFLTVKPECASCHRDVHKGQLGTDCARCHATSIGFKETRKKFDHARTGFTLVGAHRKADCASCHPNGRYRLAASARTGGAGVGATPASAATCASCHKSPHKSPVGPSCSTCHTSDTWKSQKIDHARTGFPLRGLHAKVACASCHRQPATKVTVKAQRCAECHSDPHKGRFKQDCASCHNERGFGGAPFDHGAQTTFPLRGGHSKLTCVSCHKPGIVAGAPAATRTGAAKTPRAADFGGLKADCASCHRDVHRGDAGTECRACHTDASFRDVSYVHKTRPEFFTDGHARVPCAKCHGAPPPKTIGDRLLPLLERVPRMVLASSRGLMLAVPAGQRAPDRGSARSQAREPDVVRWSFKGVTTDCASCHRDPHLGQLGPTCETCHAVAGAKFQPVKFSHAASTFALTGKHETAGCVQCHKRETRDDFPAGPGTAVRYKGIGAECRTCHQDTHLGQLGSKCELCHNATAFAVAGYKHILKPQMSDGRHDGLECRACHKQEEAFYPAGRGVAVRYLGFGETCASCHNDAHQGTLGTTCETCHTVDTFKTVSRAFHKTGSFPLEGRHLDVACQSCHIKGQIRGTPTTCYECHWSRRQDDRYQLRLGAECETCHRPISWTATRWSHVAATGIALNATHRILGCDSCHRSLEFRRELAVDCAGCHARDYQQTVEPNHVAAGFPMACEACHKPSDPDWNRARFDHNASFPLVGQHSTAACASCHRGSIYQGTPRECMACHAQDYNETSQPNHVSAGFSTNCEQCHRATDPDWRRGSFNHDQFFRLVGAHRLAQCVACHGNGVYAGTPTACVACHQQDYNETRNPNHAAAGFPTSCEQCHRPSDQTWNAGGFNHDSVFRLEGTHRTIQCAACHQNGRFAGTPRDCIGCHRADYDRTTNPNHASAGFSTSCAQCHRASSSTWGSTGFNHDAFFRLEGQHRTAQCAACHQNGRFNGTPTDCVSCHRAEYDRTTDPSHAAAGFPTTCGSCHRAADSSWGQGRFNHAFPISGPHNVACSQCHLDRNNYRVYSCTVCHERARTDSDHQGEAGYRYESTACYACHPNGRH